MKYTVEVTACSYDSKGFLSNVSTHFVEVNADTVSAASRSALLDPALADFGSLYVESARVICKCGKQFQPSHGEYHRCPECLDGQHGEAESATGV